MPHNSIWTRIKAKWRDFLNAISYKQKVALTTLSGIAIAISCHLTMPRGAILPMVVM